MNAERILQSDVLDILFEDRNKLYGAYELRRTYPRRVKKAVGAMIFLVALASAGYLFASRQNNQVGKLIIEGPTILTDIPIAKQSEEAPKPKSQIHVETHAATVKDFVPVIKPDEQVPQTEVPDTKQIDTSAIGTETKPGEAVAAGENISADPGEGKPGGNGTEPTAAPEPALPSGPIDMHAADEMPQYPGGMQALVRYMVNNLTSELEPGMKYILKAQFVINEDGNVSEAIILSSDDASLNPQVLKAIRKMKQWKPGKLRGHNVAIRFTMPVTFVGPDE